MREMIFLRMPTHAFPASCHASQDRPHPGTPLGAVSSYPCTCKNSMLEDECRAKRSSSAHGAPTRALHASRHAQRDCSHPGLSLGAVAHVSRAALRRTARRKMRMCVIRASSMHGAPRVLHASRRAHGGRLLPGTPLGASVVLLVRRARENSAVENENCV